MLSAKLNSIMQRQNKKTEKKSAIQTTIKTVVVNVLDDSAIYAENCPPNVPSIAVNTEKNTIATLKNMRRLYDLVIFKRHNKT